MSAASHELEESLVYSLDFSRFKTRGGTGVMPVCVQHADTHEVLLVGFASDEALKHSIANRVAAFWSFSRDELWVKGLTSGNTLALIEVRVNCEQNSLLYLVRPQHGGACHTKKPDGDYRMSCYYRRLNGDGSALARVE